MLEYAATLDPKSKPTAVVKKGGATGAAAAGKKEESWRDLPVTKRLEYALVKVSKHIRKSEGNATSLHQAEVKFACQGWHA